jgi:hypothetical protein
VLRIPSDFLVLYDSGDIGWLPYQHVDLEAAKAREMAIAFEFRYHRGFLRHCHGTGVMCCEEVTDEGYESPNKVPFHLRREIVEIFVR